MKNLTNSDFRVLFSFIFDVYYTTILIYNQVMPLKKLQFAPGFNKQATASGAEGEY